MCHVNRAATGMSFDLQLDVKGKLIELRLFDAPNGLCPSFIEMARNFSGQRPARYLELFLEGRDHLIEKWETLKSGRTKRIFEFELTTKM
jgi:hypothetical protein